MMRKRLCSLCSATVRRRAFAYDTGTPGCAAEVTRLASATLLNKRHFTVCAIASESLQPSAERNAFSFPMDS